MADTKDSRDIIGGFLYGRRDIFSSTEEITQDNVVDEVNLALTYHFMNLQEEEYLYWYRRGLQPVLNRRKERNTIVLNKVVENHAEEIVTFKNGYFLMEPAKYISRRSGAKGKVDKLNEYLYRSGKNIVDNVLADWFHMVGKAALYIESNDDPAIPVKVYALDPRSAFVVYSMRPGKKPLFAVNIVIDGEKSLIDVYTRNNVFRLVGGAAASKVQSYVIYEATASAVDRVEDNPLGAIPIIEYRYNSVNMGAFESVIYLLDAINNVQSNRIDGVEQFIQSIAVAVNCQFEDDVTADKIRKAGMIALRSVGENKADFRILSEELDQQQTQTLVDNLYDQALKICAMPSINQRGTSASITGSATIFNNGWEQAASSARNTEDLFKESNAYFDAIFTDILRRKGILDISMIDFDLNFVRNETANIQSKAQAMQTMLAAGMHPELAFAKSGISNDPVADVKMSEKYLKMIWGDPTKAVKVEDATNGQGEAQIVEEDSNNGENATGGSV
jgi:SPP1 family phage portal protein